MLDARDYRQVSTVSSAPRVARPPIQVRRSPPGPARGGGNEADFEFERRYFQLELAPKLTIRAYCAGLMRAAGQEEGGVDFLPER